MLLTCVLAGCGAAPHQGAPSGNPFDAFRGSFITADRLRALTGDGWRVDPDGALRADAGGNLQLYLGGAGLLEAVLEIDSPEDPAALRILWDGAPVSVTPASSCRVMVRISVATPGLHALSLSLPRAAAPAPSIVVKAATFRFAGEEATLRMASARDAHVAAFLSFGVVGHGPDRQDGILIEGSGALSVPLSVDGNATFTADLENLSASVATFSATAGAVREERTVPPQSRMRMEMSLPPGEHELAMRVEAERNGLLLVGAPWIERHMAARPPTIVLVTLDTMRRDALSPYGGWDRLTPNLADFARHATLFTEAHATAPWTLPSHASMFTGLYPGRHGAGVQRERLPRSAVTVVDLLREAGYFTAGFAGGVLCGHRFGLADGFHAYRDPENEYETIGGRLTESVTSFLREHAKRPLFVFVNYFDAHNPYAAPPEFERLAGVHRIRRRLDPGVDRGVDAMDRAAYLALYMGEHDVSPEMRDDLWFSYLAEVAYTDAQLGALFRELRALGLWEESLVIVVADHGELLGDEPRRFGHGYSLDPQLVDIPLIVKWPRQSSPERVADLASQVDLFPTILEAAGIPVTRSQGLSLAPSGRGSLAARRLLYAEEHAGPVHVLRRRSRRFLATSVYGTLLPTSRWVQWPTGSDCRVREASGWVASPCPPGMESLQDLERRLACEGCDAGPGGQLTDEDREALEALGYL